MVRLNQLLMMGVPADGDLTEIRTLQPGGIVLMGRNAGTPAKVRELTNGLRACLEEPVLIATDQEGGRVQRLTEGFTHIPLAAEVAKGGARAVGLLAMTVAAELRACGVNMNFAPVCDVPTHPDDTVIGARAYSRDPMTAALCVAEYVRAAQPTVMCCAKHFPGHGGVGVDSHVGMPVFGGTRAELEPHLVPFRAALGATVGSIMVAHVAVPALDPSGAPASLSEPVVTGLLRRELGYRGLVVTDDLEMGALAKVHEHPAVAALAAGCDLLLYCHSATKAREALAAVEGALESGRLTYTRIEDALARMDWARRRFAPRG